MWNGHGVKHNWRGRTSNAATNVHQHTAALLATSLVMEQPTVDLKVVVADVGTPFEEREKAATDRGTAMAEQVGAVVKAKLSICRPRTARPTFGRHA